MQAVAPWSARPLKGKARTRLIPSVVAVVLVSTMFAGPLASSATAFPPTLMPPSGAYLGAYVDRREGESAQQAVQRLETQMGRKLSIDHQYYRWDQAIPTAHQHWDANTGRIPFVNWKAQKADGSIVRWSAIANGSQDAWITQRADAFRAFASPIYLGFHHEPENDLSTFGTPADHAAAFRHIVTVFRDRGVTNVAFVWTMMSWTFVPASGEDPNAYYPGDDYVDFIGSDGYDWYPGKPGASWQSFGEVFQQTNDFAVSHNKPWIAVEFGVQEDPDVPGRKGQWFTDISAVARAWPLLKGLLYFDAWTDYAWIVDSSTSSKQGLATLGLDPYFNPGATIPPPVSGPTLRNSLNLGPKGAPIQAGIAARTTASDPFNQVVVSGGSTLTYDNARTLRGFAAKHSLRPGGNAYYQWTGVRSIWFGRLYVWLRQRPKSNLRLIRGSTDNELRCALDIMPNGTLRWLDQDNAPMIATTTPLATRRWVRIEWKVDHTRGQVSIKLYNTASSSKTTQAVWSATGRAVGLSAQEIQYGRSGTQPFAVMFWTDRPALSSSGWLGAT